jgi:ribosomal protein S1
MSMLDIGSVVQARVTDKKPYGVYLQHEDQSILVLAPEVAWHDTREAMDQIRPGDVLEVQILLCNYATKEFSGSLRRARQQDNPYRALSRLEPGNVLRAVVRRSDRDDVAVDLPCGARGKIPKHYLRRTPAAGEEMDVVISSLLVDEGQLWLEPAREADRGPACRVQVQILQFVS